MTDNNYNNLTREDDFGGMTLKETLDAVRDGISDGEWTEADTASVHLRLCGRPEIILTLAAAATRALARRFHLSDALTAATMEHIMLAIGVGANDPIESAAHRIEDMLGIRVTLADAVRRADWTRANEAVEELLADGTDIGEIADAFADALDERMYSDVFAYDRPAMRAKASKAMADAIRAHDEHPVRTALRGVDVLGMTIEWARRN